MRDRRLIIKNAPAYGIVGSTVSFTIRVEDTDANSGIPCTIDRPQRRSPDIATQCSRRPGYDDFG